MSSIQIKNEMKYETPKAAFTCSVKWVVVQGDGTEGKLHGSTRYPLTDRYTEGSGKNTTRRSQNKCIHTQET